MKNIKTKIQCMNVDSCPGRRNHLREVPQAVIYFLIISILIPAGAAVLEGHELKARVPLIGVSREPRRDNDVQKSNNLNFCIYG